MLGGGVASRQQLSRPEVIGGGGALVPGGRTREISTATGEATVAAASSAAASVAAVWCSWWRSPSQEGMTGGTGRGHQQQQQQQQCLSPQSRGMGGPPPRGQPHRMVGLGDHRSSSSSSEGKGDRKEWKLSMKSSETFHHLSVLFLIFCISSEKMGASSRIPAKK
jgi:hypothetical protein